MNNFFFRFSFISPLFLLVSLSAYATESGSANMAASEQAMKEINAAIMQQVADPGIVVQEVPKNSYVLIALSTILLLLIVWYFIRKKSVTIGK